MRITSKGQVTIPQAIREQAGLMPGTDVEFVIIKGQIQLRKQKPGKRKSRGARMVERLRGSGRFHASTDEVVALLRGPPAEV